MLLLFVVLAVTCLIVLGRSVSPYSSRRPVRTWGLEDYGVHLMRGMGVFFAAGQRNAHRMDRMHEEAKRRPDRAPEGLRIVEGPLDGGPDDPRRKDPTSPYYVDPDDPLRPDGTLGPDLPPHR